tara:strand:+ start:4419 stop:5096 length:678 start_codon:yes stop_codon:yes gene_type:complete
MSLIQSGKTFNDGEQLTAGKLNQMFSDATMSTNGVDGSTIIINVNDVLSVRTGGITASSLANDSVTTDKILDGNITVAKLATDALELAYPVGSIYMNASVATDPATLLGFGTWATFGAGKVLVGIDTTDDDFDIVGSGTNTNGATGAKTVKLTSAESGLPSHTHTSDGTRSGKNAADPGGNFFSSSGDFANYGAKSINVNGAADAASFHNNLQPYVVVHMWTRTA